MLNKAIEEYKASSEYAALRDKRANAERIGLGKFNRFMFIAEEMANAIHRVELIVAKYNIDEGEFVRALEDPIHA